MKLYSLARSTFYRLSLFLMLSCLWINCVKVSNYSEELGGSSMIDENKMREDPAKDFRFSSSAERDPIYNSNRVIVNANGVENPMIPVAAGIGGEVIVACSECRKLMTHFVDRCVDQEAAGLQADTFRTFCESYRDKLASNINPEACLILNAKLASVTGESGTEIVDPTKPPNECIKFRSQCNNFGGAPYCYSGFCEMIAECIDCPTALVDKNKNGNFVPEVCGLNGVCRLGWKNPTSKGGNGYCECRSNMKGSSCNEY